MIVVNVDQADADLGGPSPTTTRKATSMKTIKTKATAFVAALAMSLGALAGLAPAANAAWECFYIPWPYRVIICCDDAGGGCISQPV